MAVIAAQTIAWATPTVFPQGQAVSFATASMGVMPVNMANVVAAPEPTDVLAPDSPPPTSITFG